MFYNMDSKLPKPKVIDNFPQFINDHLEKGNELLLVTKPDDADKCINKKSSHKQ